MPLTVVIGGQFGSEGKGKTVYHFINEQNAKAVIRVGGPNSGHTIYHNKKKFIFRNLPVSAVHQNIFSILPSGSYINLDVILNEIEISGITEKELIIDPFAVIIGNEDISQENHSKLIEEIGSTGSGTGAAVINRIRRKEVTFAKDTKELKKYIRDSVPFARELLDKNERIIIEGTQGFGLSLLHSQFHPYTTSRDTTAAGFLSEAGLSPLDVDDIVMVIRAFPIRVGGNSGPLPNETTWEEVSKRSGNNNNLQEFTTVTKRLRRVAYFDTEIVKKAILYNNPTKIVLNHLDYIDYYTCADVSIKQLEFIHEIEKQINHKIEYIGTNPQKIYTSYFIKRRYLKISG